MAALATREYWDARYELDKLPFDWYCRFNTSDAYKNLVCALIKKEHNILIVGAGTSRLPEELIEADYNYAASTTVRSPSHSSRHGSFRA